jgi:hypothetical protein
MMASWSPVGVPGYSGCRAVDQVWVAMGMDSIVCGVK